MTTMPADDALAAPRVSLGERLSDRCNPIFVREIQQAVGSRMFAVTVGAGLTAVVLLAFSSAAARGGGLRNGRDFFIMGLILLTPILSFVIPLQAFMSMRREVAGGTAEQLLLTELTPAGIVRGKLAAAMLQFFLHLGIFAPVLALAFLLRGIDVATIALMLVLACLSCLVATTVAIALGSLSRFRVVQNFNLAIAGTLLGGYTVGTMAGMWDLVRGLQRAVAGREFAWLASVLIVCGALAVVLFAMIAASTLTHPYENRSTKFRVFPFLAYAATVALVLSCPWLDRDGWLVLLSLPIFAAVPIWLFAVTEVDALSPRVRTLVPRGRLRAFLAVPFLPGGPRGMVHTVLFYGIATGSSLLLMLLFASHWPSERDVFMMLMAGAYLLLYALIVFGVRRFLPQTARGTWLARLGGPALIALLVLLPTMIDVFARDRLGGWHVGHILNAPWTIREFRHEASLGLCLVLGMDAVLLLFFVRPLRAAFREVRVASGIRRDAAR